MENKRNNLDGLDLSFTCHHKKQQIWLVCLNKNGIKMLIQMNVMVWWNDIMIMVGIMDMLRHHIKLKYHFQFGSNNHNQRNWTIKMELKVTQCMTMAYGIKRELKGNLHDLILINPKHVNYQESWENYFKKINMANQLFLGIF